MTSPSDMQAIERFANSSNANGLGFSNGIVADENGHYVRHSDYEALARKVEEMGREIAALPFAVEYRRHNQPAWTPMAAFDQEIVANRYRDDCNQSINSQHWEYRVVSRARTLLEKSDEQ